MKKIFLLTITISFFIISSCNSNSRVNYSVHDDISNSNDTICFGDLNKFKVRPVKLLKACHIIYSDSFSNYIASLYGGGRLPKYYNFNIQFDPQSFTLKGDTIDLKILYMSRFRPNHWIPDTIFMKDDTLFVGEKNISVEKQLVYDTYKFEEFHYQFLLFDKNYSPIIKSYF